MNTKYTYLLMAVFLLVAVHLNAQEKYIRGIVTTQGTVPLVGVEVKVKSTNQIVKTDTLGQFAVTCNYNDKLIVSSEGFYSQKVKIKKPTKFAAVNLKMFPVKKGRAFDNGYGKVLEDSKISALDNINNEDFNFSVYNDVFDLIKGRFPGVEIKNGEIIIRGLNSFNASSAATILVDGATVNQRYLHSISPANVKNVSVIKDASAAVYGFQGSNGVILIETKKGGEEL